MMNLLPFVQSLFQISVFITAISAVILAYHFIQFGSSRAFQLRAGEKLVLIRRRHWFTLIQDFWWLIVLLLILAAAAWLYQANYQLTFITFDPASVALIIMIAAEALIIMSLTIFADYWLDFWIVTDQRSIRVELKGFFNRHVISINHDRVQEISVTVSGVSPTLLNYGQVHIQTAGAEAEFVFENIPDPYAVKTAIFKAANLS